MDPADLSSFSGEAPLFPLPNVVLFPKTVLPLHVFEPRYRAMTEAALAGDRLVAMALLKPGWEPDYQGTPAVHEVVGLGRIVQEQKLPDGRYNIVLVGIRRARIASERTTDDRYRVAKLELCDEKVPDDPRLEQVRLGLLAVYATLAEKIGKGAAKPDAQMPVGFLCDLLAAFLETDSGAKQQVLEELNVAARAEKVVELLKRSSLAALELRSGLKSAKLRWPPTPSLN